MQMPTVLAFNQFFKPSATVSRKYHLAQTTPSAPCPSEVCGRGQGVCGKGRVSAGEGRTLRGWEDEEWVSAVGEKGASAGRRESAGREDRGSVCGRGGGLRQGAGRSTISPASSSIWLRMPWRDPIHA